MSPADQVLFDQWISRRDASAFTRLAEKYASMVYAVGRRITGNTHDAEDVAQAAFEALASQRRAPKVHLGAWLHRVATYRALNHLKAERRRADREARYDRERPKHAVLQWDDVYDLVDEAIAALPAKQRDVVVAHYLEGKTHDAIAWELGISRPAVTQRVQAAVVGIRAALGKRGVAVPMALLGVLLVHGAEAATPVALAAQLGKIALSGYAGKTGAGIGLWQGMVAGLGTAKGMAACAFVVVAAGLGIAGLAQVQRDGRDTPARTESYAQASPSVDLDVLKEDASSSDAKAAPHIEAPVAAFSANSHGARIFGKVVDTRGEPAAGAQVQLVGSEDLRRGAGWVSEQDGTFGFPDVVPTETCWIIAFTGNNEQTQRGSQVELKPVLSGESYEVVLTLFEGVIAGRVLDQHARPMPGVEILASPQWNYHGGLPTAVTGEDGRYHMAGVMEGDYEMQIKPGEGGYFETGVKVRSDGSGVRSEVNLIYRVPEGGVVHGRVTNEDGEPLEGAYVGVSVVVPPHTSEWTFTDADGNYEIRGMVEGPNIISAMHPDYGDGAARDAALDGDPVDFVLARRGAVNGQVVHADTGDAIPEFEILTWEPSSDLQWFAGSERWIPHKDTEGHFSLVLKPGDHPLRIRAKGFTETNVMVELRPGEVLEGARVPMRPAAVLRGIVVDGANKQPVAGARIARNSGPAEFTLGRESAALSDEAGQFRLVDASPDGETLTASYPGYAPSRVEVAPGQKDVEIALRKGITVTGTVTINGAPFEGAQVQAHENSLLHATVMTDVAGRFKFESLPEKGMRFNATIRQSGSLDKTREQLFEPDVTWHPGAESIHFDFMQNRAELLVTIMKSEQVQSRVLVEARQDLGNGYSDSTSTSTDFHGIARFENLSEGHWDVLVRFPKTGASGGSLHMTAQLSSDTTLMLQRDLDQPEVEVENIVSTRNSHDAEKPVDGEQVSAPLIEEVRGDEAESSTGPS